MSIDTFDVEMKMRNLRGKEGKQKYVACIYKKNNFTTPSIENFENGM